METQRPKSTETVFRQSMVLKYFLLLLLSVLFLCAGPVNASEGEPHVKERLKKNAWKGDFDGMKQRRIIRALVTFSKTNYFLDKMTQRGITYELLKQFEKDINKNLKQKHLKTILVIIPVTRDQLIPGLLKGIGDIAAANLTITPERQKKVDFADPLLTGVDEIVVAGPKAPKIASLGDLSGKEVYVRKSSSYYESLSRINASLKKQGKRPILVKTMSEYLETEDILEMVNAGLVPMTVVDSTLAVFWSQVFPNLTLHPKITTKKGGQIAWMVRKDSPKLKKVVNDFVKTHKKGTLMGNILLKRYLKNTKYITNSHAKEDMERFHAAVGFFKKYAKTYDMDWLLVAAVGYQESRIDQSVKSPAGAIGVMQMLPSTAKAHPVNIPEIQMMEKNIQAGIKYLDWLYETYYEKEDMDRLNKHLFTFAAYNAGAGKISRLRKEAKKAGFDPNIWFGNVEVIAAKRIGRETVQYVSNIFKYYVAYRLIMDKRNKKEALKKKKR
ncbi:transglycosylase SLT domain-containing protein [Thermodesulfobacteriota bacterium]